MPEIFGFLLSQHFHCNVNLLHFKQQNLTTAVPQILDSKYIPGRFGFHCF